MSIARRVLALGAVACAGLLAVSGPLEGGDLNLDPPAPTAAPAPSPEGAQPAVPATGPSSALHDGRLFAYYYLWWSEAHWTELLGPNYPLAALPQPLPATLDPSGCDATPAFEASRLVDVQQHPRGQDEPGVIESDVRNAIAAGLDGFAVNWVGTGSADQRAEDSRYTMRLQTLVDVVHEVRAEGHDFTLWFNYRSSATIRSLEEMDGDLAFLSGFFADDPAFDRHFGRPVLVLAGSRKYSTSHLRTISQRHRDDFFLVGDETGTTWNAARADLLDGDHYYWSSQNPVANPRSFEQLRELAYRVHSGPRNPDGTSKAWIAPVTPGYNATLIGGTSCVPRRDGETLRALATGNAESKPDAWLLISWNEIAEGTYVQPMTRYGDRYLQVLREVFG